MWPTLYWWQSHTTNTGYTIIKHHFICKSVSATSYRAISNSTEEFSGWMYHQCLINPEESVVQVWENLSSSNINPPSTSTLHTPTGVVPIQTATTYIHSGRYTIHNSKVIEHISDDSDDEINITQGDIRISNMLLLLLNHVKLPTMYI